MKLRTLMTATVTATLLATASMAQTVDPVQSIVDDLAAAGYTQIHITKKMNKIEVVAVGPNGAVEQTYSQSGDLLETHPTSTAAAKADIAEASASNGAGDNGADDNGMDDNGTDDNGADDNDDDRGSDRDNNDSGSDRDNNDNDRGSDRNDDDGRDGDDDRDDD